MAQCSAESSGEGYWTCDVLGGCPGCRELARSLDDLDQIAEWDNDRKGSPS